jgi:hypothetical protein
MRMKNKITVSLVGFALALCGAAIPALAVPIVELKAQGSYPDPHDITVTPGTNVRLEYTISSADRLGYFQNTVSAIGIGQTDISATKVGTWWGSQQATQLRFNYRPTLGTYILLGECTASSPPFSYSSPSEVSLAFLDVVAPDTGSATIDLLSLGGPVSPINMWVWVNPSDFNDFGEIEVDTANSRPRVTIRVGGGQPDYIPEPASVLLLSCGLGALAYRRRRRA